MRVTLFQNGVSRALVCDIPAGSNTCTITGPLVLAVGDTVELQVQRTGGKNAFVTMATTTLIEDAR